MSSTSRRAAGPVSGLESWLVLFVAVPMFAFMVIGYGAFELTGRMAGEKVPASPVLLGGDLIRGRLPVPAFFWAVALVTLFGLFSAIVSFGIAAANVAQDPPDTWLGRWVIRTQWMLPDRHVFRAAKWMGQGRQIKALLAPAAQKKAARFGVQGAPGRLLGTSVLSGQRLYADYEAVGIDISGPRHYKTTARATPAIVTAPGAALATSNKPDLVFQTRGAREDGGGAIATGNVDVFDPDKVAHEPNTCWWDTLTYVKSEREALQLADIWSTAAREEGAKTDAFFEPAGSQLVADLVLAAAVAPRRQDGSRQFYVDQVHKWLSQPDNDEAVGILKVAGFPEFAADLHEKYHAPPDQKGGVFATALVTCSFMVNGSQMRWVLPPHKWRVPPAEGQAAPREFVPEAFVRSGRAPVVKTTGHLWWRKTVVVEQAKGDTLYSMSREGKANAGPIVAALTIAITEAAESYAKQCGGRLPIPLTVQLDEVANVCKVRQLPAWWSFWGSHGIVATCYLQSWSQGVGVWGEGGMEALWSASNVKIYGGNVSKVKNGDFLSNVSDTVGKFDQYSRSLTTGHGDTLQRSTHREVILDVDDLQAMEPGVMVVMGGGVRAVLARAIPFWQLETELAAAVEASLDKYDPQRTYLKSDATDVQHTELREVAVPSRPATVTAAPAQPESPPVTAASAPPSRSPLSAALRQEVQAAATRTAAAPSQQTAAPQFAVDDPSRQERARDPYAVLEERFGGQTRGRK